jgi:hypothetical protein
MPDQPVTVKIRRSPNDPMQCLVVPKKFGAHLGGTVAFEHEPDLPTVLISFKGSSPFKEGSFKSGQALHTVIAEGSFKFDVSWPEPGGQGKGDGTGEVPPG